MNRGLLFTLFAAIGLAIFVYAQEKKTAATTMPVVAKAPKPMGSKKAKQLTDADWKKRLSPAQYRILREAGTEPPNGKIYKEFKAQGGGTYYCAGCNAELFSSDEKFDSHCGWPSFYDPSKAKNVRTEVDVSGFMERTEVLCAVCDGHLGHVFTGERFDAFNGGTTPTGQRYCINGTALKFVPAIELSKDAAKKKAEKATQPQGE